MAFSPNRTILAAAGGRETHTIIILWDAFSGKEIRRIEGKDLGDHIAFSPDGKTLASVRNHWPGSPGSYIHLWDVPTGKLIGRLQHNDSDTRCSVRAVAFSPNGKILASHSQFGSVRLWDLAVAKELLTIPTNGTGSTIAFSPNGKLVAFEIADTVRLCQVKTGKVVFELKGHRKVTRGAATYSGSINAIAFSSDGKLLASASCDNTVRIWSVANNAGPFIIGLN